MNNINSKKEGKKTPLRRGQFSRTNQPKRRRGKGVIAILNEAIGEEYKINLSANEILDISQIILEQPEDVVKRLLKDNEQAMLVKIVSEKLLNKKNNDAMYDKILDRLLKREGYRDSKEEPIKLTFEEGDDGLSEM